MKLFTLIEIEWQDAHSSVETMTVKQAIEIYKPINIKSVGYYIHQNSSYIIIAFTKFNDKVFKHWQVIPNKNIINIKEICGTNKKT